MSLLQGLKKNHELAGERDSLGGAQLLDSDIYPSTISMAYMQKSASEATGVFLTFKTEAGKEVNQTIYITSGKEKGCKPTYTDKEGNDQYLPGYLQVDGLCLLTIGKELGELEEGTDLEEKTISVWDSTAKAKVLKKMPVLTTLIGQKVNIGVLRQQVNKQEKGDGGVYHATTDIREENEINKFFRAEDGLTVPEIVAGETEAKFSADWLKKYKGQVLDKTVKNAKAPSAKPAGGASGAPAAAKPKSSLFGKPAA